MTEPYPFRKPTKQEVRKKKFQGAFVLAGMLVGGLAAWIAHRPHFEVWVAGGLVVGLIAAFVAAFVRGEQF